MFREVISSCDVLLSSSLGLAVVQADNLDELKDPEVVNVLFVSPPKLRDNLGFFPATGVLVVQQEGDGISRAFCSPPDGIKSDSFVGDVLFWQIGGGRERAGRSGRKVRVVILDFAL